MLQELPDATRVNILSIFDQVGVIMHDMDPISEQCLSQFGDLRSFIQTLLDNATDGIQQIHQNHQNQQRQSKRQLLDGDDFEIGVGSAGSAVQTPFLDHIGHLEQRQKYAEVISELEEYLNDAQKHCKTVSAALRNGASEMSKSDDKVEWLSITTSINRNVDQSLNLIHKTLEESLREIKTAGKLLMQNDRQIEHYQEQLKFLTESLDKERQKYFHDSEVYSSEIHKVKDEISRYTEELQQERVIVERRSVEVRRLEKENSALTKRLENKMQRDILENGDLKLLMRTLRESPLVDEKMENLLTSTFNHFESCFMSERELRYKCKELSRHLDDSKMRRQYEKCNYKKKVEQIKNSRDQEKIGIENRHNLLVEKLQDEIQLWRSTNGSSNFDVQVAMEQMEDALHEAHIQIRDKDEEIDELREEVLTLQSEQKEVNMLLDPMETEMKQREEPTGTATGTETGNGNASGNGTANGSKYKLDAIEMRKGLELYEFIYGNLEEIEREQQCDLRESFVLLKQLKHELELYGGLLSERDTAIHILEDRLSISQNAEHSFRSKYNKIRHKLLAQDDDSDNLSAVSHLEVHAIYSIFYIFGYVQILSLTLSLFV